MSPCFVTAGLWLNTMHSEKTANEYLQREAMERARWAQVLARPTAPRVARAVAKRSIFARLLGL